MYYGALQEPLTFFSHFKTTGSLSLASVFVRAVLLSNQFLENGPKELPWKF